MNDRVDSVKIEKNNDKKNYNVPILKVMGKVHDLTKGGIGLDFDSQTGNNDGAVS